VQEVNEFLPDPYTFAIVLHGLVLVPLVAALRHEDADCKQIWRRISIGGLGRLAYAWRHFAMLLTIAAFVLVWYLSVVPPTSTGLYVVFTEPASAALAREDSFKLLQSAPLRYAFATFALTVAPILLVLLLVSVSRTAGRSFFSRCLSGLCGAMFAFALTAAVSLSGARSFAVTLWLAAIAAWWLSRELQLRTVLKLALGACFLLALPVSLTLAREGRLSDLGEFSSYFWTFVQYRIFTAPTEVGTWYVHYAQTEGVFGLAAIPKLADLFGYLPIDVPNLIGRTYYGGSLSSVNANAGFGFTYYSYFGMFGWLISVVGLLVLDVVLLAYKRLGGALLLACLAATSIAALAFTYADYTTVLVTNGFFVAPLLCLGLHALSKSDPPSTNWKSGR